jgi:hypothetical protein
MQVLFCFHCCHKIEGAILHMPIEFKNNEFLSEGNFCSIACMKTYNLALNDSFKNKRFMYINVLANNIHGTLINNFAPRKEELSIFGGNLSISEFRKHTKKHISIKTIPPMKVVKNNIESDFTLIRGHNKPQDINNNIKLERKKPLNNSQNTLESTMGIFLNKT